MIWLDIGICCGYRRKMEIAESHFQPLCTVRDPASSFGSICSFNQALRKAGAFNKSFYKRIIPSPSDDDETLEVKWRQWVEQESYKRSVDNSNQSAPLANPTAVWYTTYLNMTFK